jgi:hypothetical protein
LARTNRKQFEKLQEQFQTWKDETERTRKKKLWARIQIADQARLELEAGPNSLKSVGFLQRMRDRLAAIFHSLLRLHIFCDPVVGYERSLKAKVAVLTSKARAAQTLRKIVDSPDEPVEFDSERLKKREDGTEITLADHWRAQVAFKKAFINRLGRQLGATSKSLDDFLKEVNEEVEDTEKDYKEWYAALQRPAYFEIFRTSAAPLSESTGAAKSQSDVAKAMPDQEERRQSRFARFLKVLLGEYSAPILVPLEAFYSYAAFLLVTPHNSVLAVAAASIFTLSLTTVGAGAAHFALRSFRHRIVPVETTGSKAPTRAIKSTINRRMLWTSILMATIGLVLIYGGADLRSKLPIVDVWTDERSEILSELAQLQSTQLQTDESPDATNKRNEERTALEKRLVEHDKARQDILRADFSISNSDEIVAIGIYFALFFAAAATYILGLDPYFEYGLLARYLADVRILRRNVRVLQELKEKSIENQREEHEVSLLEARAKLWLLDKDDPAGLSPYESVQDPEQRQAACRAQAENDKSTDTAAGTQGCPRSDTSQDVAASLGDAWVSDRLARYARWYILFFGRSAQAKCGLTFQRALEQTAK